MSKKTLKQINANIEATEELIYNYIDKKDKLKLNPVKYSHSLICGTIGSMLGMSMVTIPKMDSLILLGLGGFLAGYTVPYVVRKIRIGELDYQILINKGIINDLKKEKKDLVKTKVIKK